MTEWTRDIGSALVGIESVEDVYEEILAILGDIVDPDACLVSIAVGDSLHPVASSPKSWEPGPFSISTSNPGCVFRLQQPCVIDDLTEVRSSAASTPSAGHFRSPNGDLLSLLAVPVGDVGVLLAADEERGSFSEADLEDVVVLADIASGALTTLEEEGAAGPDRLEEIASILSHDLKSPLQIARGQIQLAEETGDFDHLSAAIDALDRINDLADDLAMLARTDDRISEPVPIELSKLATTAWEPVKTPMATMELVGSAPIIADESTACQLLENLFMNALAHGGDDVHIRVGIQDDGFYVEDDGPGIPAEDRADAFEWGFSTSDDHAGIGLAIVDRIAQAHGWELTVTNSSEGGARFEFSGVRIDHRA